MDFITQDILSKEIVPVLLGLSPEATLTARRMYRQYGVISHVFCHKLPLPLRLTLCMKFHVVHHTTGEQLMRQALSDFATQLENLDVILYLIPCTEAAMELIWHHREELERRFVLADKPELYRVWFGEDATLPKKGAST